MPGIRRAREMGLHVIATDQNPQAPGLAEAHDALIASTYDVEATVNAARHYHETVRPIDGVICMAADVPVTVAAVAAELGLPGPSLDTARLSSDKLAMKRHFQAGGIPVPWFAAVESIGDLRRMVRQKGYGMVLKPVDSRGARGVFKLAEGIDLEWAFHHSRKHSPAGRVMVEEFLDGPQISTESILAGGRSCTPGFIDRNYERLHEFAPYVIEDGGQQPSRLSGEQRAAVCELAERAAQSMGIQNGTAKGDLVLTDSGPYVIEMAARLSGGWMSSHQIPLATGVDVIEAAVQLALGHSEKVSIANGEPGWGVAIRYFFPPLGRLLSIRSLEAAGRHSWVEKLEIFAKAGDFLKPVHDHTQRAGFVITTGKDRRQAVDRAQQVIRTVEFETVAE